MTISKSQNIDQSLIIKNTKAQPAGTIVAGQPVKWKILVSRNDIKKDNYLVQIPKTAQDIKIVSVSGNAEGSLQAGQPVSLEEKKNLAMENQANSFFLASVANGMSNFFVAGMENGIQLLADLADPKIKFSDEAKVVDLSSNSGNSFAEVDYQTPAPQISEQDLGSKEIITVSAPTEAQDGTQLKNVLAYANLPKEFKVGQENDIKIIWKNNENQNIALHAYDTNNDGYLDYVEWTVPHLSTQTFEIIFISKAYQLDSNKNIIADIYDKVKAKDNNWANLSDGQYVRVTFEKALSKSNDNTIYAKSNPSTSSGQVEVYPVYTDKNGNQTEGAKVATFPAIGKANTYKVLLSNLQTPTNIFDLKIIGNIDIDYIVDPTGIYSTLHSFGGPPSDGMYPGNLLRDGNTLYGTTIYGGTYGNGNIGNDNIAAYGPGTIFSISTTGSNFTVLHSFNGNDGRSPEVSFIHGSILYGITATGGTLGKGTIFSEPEAGGTLTTLYNFDGTHGSVPEGVVLSSDGNTLYGTTNQGGASNLGTIFSCTISGGTCTLAVLHSFNGPDGSGPRGSITLSGSTLYGSTYIGGAPNLGTIFSISTTGSNFQVLHSFNGSDGQNPESSPIVLGSMLYGGTKEGGAFRGGAMYSLPAAGGLFTLLHSFYMSEYDGYFIENSFVPSNDGGTLYGISNQGGDDDNGTIFSISTTGSNFTVLRSFINTYVDGTYPMDITISNDGTTLYGTAFYGGGNEHYGTVYSFVIPPTQTPVTPVTNAVINNITNTISITNSEQITSGTITVTRTGGTADSTTHVCHLTGNALQSGLHIIDFTDATDMNNCTEPQTLVGDAIYSFAFSATDTSGNTSITVTNTGITYDVPTVTGVTSSAADGTYTLGQVIPIQVNFSKNVTVTGKPQLILSTGSPATTTINYWSGSGTSTLTFNYTVAYGNHSAVLDYASTTALVLNGGTIADSVSSNANLTLAVPGNTNSLSANKNLVINGNLCYQEDAVQNNQSGNDGNCGLIYTGSHNDDGTWAGGNPSPYLFNGIWNTYSDNASLTSSTGSYAWVTYKKPPEAQSGSQWKVEDDNDGPPTTYYLNIPYDCWNAYSDKLEFQILSTTDGNNDWVEWSCSNGLNSWEPLRGSKSDSNGGGDVFQEAMLWSVTLNTAIQLNGLEINGVIVK